MLRLRLDLRSRLSNGSLRPATARLAVMECILQLNALLQRRPSSLTTLHFVSSSSETLALCRLVDSFIIFLVLTISIRSNRYERVELTRFSSYIEIFRPYFDSII